MSAEPPRILLVEDEQDICSSLQSYLSRRGFTVTTTASGREALILIETGRPDLVILDLTLYELSGQEVLKRLRQHDRKTRVIVLTGQLLPDNEIEDICNLGIVEYFKKPFVLARLGESISRVIGNKEAAGPGPEREESAEGSADSPGAAGHKLANLLGIIRNKCENFTLNLEEGIYKDKTDKDLLRVSAEIMNDIIKTVDRAAEVVDKIKG